LCIYGAVCSIFLIVGVLKEYLCIADRVNKYFPRSESSFAFNVSVVSGTPSTSDSVSSNSGGSKPLNNGGWW